MSKARPDEYWKSLDNTISEARTVMRKHRLESLPSALKLGRLGCSGLTNAIKQYHGGFHRFRKILGQEVVRREPRAWQDLDYTVSEALAVMKKHGFDGLPSSEKLNQLGYSSLGAAIRSYHGGFHEFRKLLGQGSIRKETGIWKNQNYALAEARAIMKEHGLNALPSSEKLRQLGHGGLINAINKYHGGFPAFRRLLKQELLKREQGTWQSLEYSLSEARAVIKRHRLDILPPYDILCQLRYSDLANAIGRYHGGFTAFRRLLGEQPKPVVVSTPEELERFIEEQPTAKGVVSIAAMNGYTSQVARILVREWPERFPSYEDAMKRLPQLVSGITSALQPIIPVGDGRHLEKLIELLGQGFSPPTRMEIADLLYQIGLQEYQRPFSHNPKRTLAKLEQKVKTAVNEEVSQLYRGVYTFYQEVFRFNIPGYGNLAAR